MRESSVTVRKSSMTVRKSRGTMRKDDPKGGNIGRWTWNGTDGSIGRIRNTIARSKRPRPERGHCHLAFPPPRRH